MIIYKPILNSPIQLNEATSALISLSYEFSYFFLNRLHEMRRPDSVVTLFILKTKSDQKGKHRQRTLQNVIKTPEAVTVLPRM